MITVKEINPIHVETWLAEFQQSDLFHCIRSDYQHVISSYREMTVLRAALNHTVYAKSRDFCQQFGILDVVPYYYIQKVMEINPELVIDLGCGLNVFKKTWPNIIGIDADENSNCDIMDHFDRDFAQGHQQYCDALISVNAIHFAPIDQITQRLQWCANLVKPGGRAFVSFNLETWLMYTDIACISQLFGSSPQLDDIVNYVDHAVKSLSLDLIIYDWPILRVAPESTIRDDLNGNIRLVFQQ
jgi:SAM-dependent methyltransferase